MPKASSILEPIPETRSLITLRNAAAECRRCPLWESGTQTVFGEGQPDARVMLVGEQPGNDEDLAGRPFVGPAGRVLDSALADAGIDRAAAYVSNVVKHFKWTPKGKRRLHQKPNAREIGACLPWLEREIDLIRPLVLVCLGATAAQAILGRSFRVTAHRGEVLESRYAKQTVATVHPSSILRATTAEARERDMALFVADLSNVVTLLGREDQT
jgi:uracil-DNA glycosylase family protein